MIRSEESEEEEKHDTESGRKEDQVKLSNCFPRKSAGKSEEDKSGEKKTDEEDEEGLADWEEEEVPPEEQEEDKDYPRVQQKDQGVKEQELLIGTMELAEAAGKVEGQGYEAGAGVLGQPEHLGVQGEAVAEQALGEEELGTMELAESAGQVDGQGYEDRAGVLGQPEHRGVQGEAVAEQAHGQGCKARAQNQPEYRDMGAEAVRGVHGGVEGGQGRELHCETAGGARQGGHNSGHREPQYTPSKECSGAVGRKEVGEASSHRRYYKFKDLTNIRKEEQGAGVRNLEMKDDLMMRKTGTIMKQVKEVKKKPPARKRVKQEELKPEPRKSKNIKEVMRMWMDRDMQEKMEKAAASQENTPEIIVGTSRPTKTVTNAPLITLKTVENVHTNVDNSPDRSLFTFKTVENVHTTVDNSPDENTNTDLDSLLTDMTVVNDVENAVDYTDLNVHSVTNYNVMTDLPRKRKASPVNLVQDSPVRKMKSTPVRAGRKKKDSTSGSENNSKINLITNHFQLYSSAQRTGSVGQAGLEAAGVHVGGDGGGGGTVQAARAELLSGLKRLGDVGRTEQIKTADTIGPDRSADDISPNTGGRTIQLIKRQLQRGNSKNSS